MPRKLDGTYIQTGTVTTTQLSSAVTTQISAGGGPRVSSLIYPGNDTAGNTVGGQTIYINGSSFETNNAIYINGNAVPSKSFISASNLSFTTPALSAGIYPVYVINTDSGATAIFVPGYIASAEPAWVTSAGSLAADQDEATAWSYSLSATGDAPITYALASGSTLPSGISLAANGVVSGTLSSPPGTETTYTFSVVATDAENQESTRQFTVSTTPAEGVLFANNVLLIHADGTNNKNNHTFLDSSNNNFTITRNGNATQGSFSPFSQTGWSGYFDGSGDYLSISSNSAFSLGTGDFTCEGWVYLTANTGSGGNNIIDFRASEGGTPWTWFIKNTGGENFLGAYTSFGATGASTTTQPIPLNKWRHVAVTRQSGTWRFFVDGVSATITGSGYDGNLGSSSNPLTIFASVSSGTAIPGYLSNLRIIKGNALYTSNFTPPITPLTAVSNTSLLTCQSNRFIDNSNNNFAITRNGDTSIQAFTPFAPTAAYSTASVGGSGYFDGTGDYLTLPSSSNLAFGTGDFSVEMWVYFTGSPASDQLLTNISGSETEFSFRIDASNYPKVQSWFTNYPISNTAVTSDQWYHLVACRASNTLSIFVNGKKTANATVTNNFSSTNAMTIGGTSGSEFCGYISSMRITKGSSPYDPTLSTLTVPTAPLTNIANTSLLCNFTNAGIFDQTAKTVLETVGDTKVSTTQYKYGTGSMYFDGTGDYLKTPNNAILTFGTGDFTIELWAYPISQGGHGSSNNDCLIDFRPGTNGVYGTLYIFNSGTGVYWFVNNANRITGGAISNGTWTHIAIARASGSTKLFINGTQSGSTYADTNNYLVSPIRIGEFNDGIGGGNFQGYIDDLRITKGYARYTTTFSPPTSALKDR